MEPLANAGESSEEGDESSEEDGAESSKDPGGESSASSPGSDSGRGRPLAPPTPLLPSSSSSSSSDSGRPGPDPEHPPELPPVPHPPPPGPRRGPVARGPVGPLGSRSRASDTRYFKQFRWNAIGPRGARTGLSVHCYIDGHAQADCRCTRSLTFRVAGGVQRCEHILALWCVLGFGVEEVGGTTCRDLHMGLDRLYEVPAGSPSLADLFEQMEPVSDDEEGGDVEVEAPAAAAPREGSSDSD